MLRPKNLLLLGLTGLLALAGTPAAEAKNVCVDACLAPYFDANAVTSAASSACSRACKAMSKPRRTCLREVTKFWNTQIGTCKKSLRLVKQGQPAPIVTSILTTTYTGAPVQTEFILTMNGTCVAGFKELKADYVQTCKELLCPANQYWDLQANACIAPPPNPATTTADPLPATIRGFYKRSWILDGYQGPIDTNVGVTFTGWTPANPQDANIAPLTNRPLNLLSYGGVDWNQNGAWSIARVQSVAAPSNLDAVVGLGYDGIVIDAEESTEIVPIPEWNAMFDAIKARGLILVVTISHFAPYAMANGQQLAADWVQNPRIDVLSPQLYSNGTESQNDWAGYNPAFKTAVPRIAPSIVQPWYYDRVGSNSVIDPQWLPNSSGYFVWSNTPALGANNGQCYTFQVGQGTGCAYMCDLCANNLGTNNYYFTDGVCKYVAGQGCQGNPQTGVKYTCCRAG